jgi:hypothetical protein
MLVVRLCEELEWRMVTKDMLVLLLVLRPAVLGWVRQAHAVVCVRWISTYVWY